MLHILYFYYVSIMTINITFSLKLNKTSGNELMVLEKEKNDLIKQIHVAIDEGVSLLEKENTTQNVEGIQYMLELKQQIYNPILSEEEEANPPSIKKYSNSELENRRKMLNSKHPAVIKRQSNLNGTNTGKEFYVNRILFNKNLSKDQLKKLMENRSAMQKRLDEWILQRQIEKAKIHNRYIANKRLVRAGLLEKCPRFGYQSKIRKRNRRRHKYSNESDEKPHKVRRDIMKKKYPCCRKCCKKSYMGCL